MKLALYTISLLIVIASCQSKEQPGQPSQTKKAVNNAPKIDSTKLLVEGRVLRDIIFQDTINLDSLRWCIDNGTDLNFQVPFENKYTTGPFREGGLLYTIFSTNHSDELKMSALQSLLFKDPENFEEALSILLQAGADPNPKLHTKYDLSPINIALDSRIYKIWVYDTLINYGADPTDANLLYLGENIDLIYYFLNKGANAQTVNLNRFLPDPYWQTPKRWKTVFDSLMTFDVDPQKVQPRNIVSSGSINQYALDKLIAKGIDFNKPCKLGMPHNWLFHVLRDSRHNKEFVIYLLEHGVTEIGEEYDGELTAYDIAEYSKFDQEVLDLIEEKIGR